ncbi:two-component system response regulator [candidate division KSB1 bacterium RBG_16_48_16]|nr:MAG: two-component system response regulator [candidate division KSB1 bacterium RBG_16_48_16]
MHNDKSILLVEDDRVDAMTVRRAFSDLKVTNKLVAVGNGEEALVFLQNGNNDKPCLILLDINMPKMNGIEFLKIAKNDHGIKSIPVVILTTSQEERDRMEGFSNGVAGYMIKPVDYLQFVETMRTIQMYWTLSEIPD